MSNIKSIRSTQSLHAKFKNATERHVDLYWLDFRGKLVRYILAMEPGSVHDMTTYVTHPWVARDNVTGQSLYLSGQSVYIPVAPAGTEAEDEEEDVEGIAPVHVGSIEITIHIPVFRLEEICVGFFRKHLNAMNLKDLDVSIYLKEKLANIPKPQARIYRPGLGITDD